MLTNPYPQPRNDAEAELFRLQTYISGEDKSLLVGLRPVKGTAQTIVNNLILNLCRDLRDLNIISFHPDADDILAILTERRPLTAEQCQRLRRTTVSLPKKIPTGLFQHSGGTSVREGVAGASAGADHTAKQTSGGKQSARTKETSKTKESTKGKTDS